MLKLLVSNALSRIAAAMLKPLVSKALLRIAGAMLKPLVSKALSRIAGAMLNPLVSQCTFTHRQRCQQPMSGRPRARRCVLLFLYNE